MDGLDDAYIYVYVTMAEVGIRAEMGATVGSGRMENCDESKEEVEGRRRKEEEKESTTPRRSTRPCAHCGRQVPLYRSTECNLPRNLCTGMRQTSRNKRFILAHAVVARIQHTLF